MSFERGTEPLGLRDNTESSEGFVELEFSSECLRRGAVSLSIVDDGDETNTDMGVATLW